MNGMPIMLNQEREVTLTPYIVSQKQCPTILIAPGGGYLNHSEWECEPVAKAYNAYGYNAFVLKYSTGAHYQLPYPLMDFDQAMEYLKDHAEELCVDVDHIIAAGFSAGGHLVSVAVSQAKHKPFAAVICYGLTLGNTVKSAPDAPDANAMVNPNTCPCFLAASRTDWIVPVKNITTFVEALNQNFVDYELHIYGYAPHGFAVGDAAGEAGTCARVGNWVKDSAEWIQGLISGQYVSIHESAAYNDTYGTIPSTGNSCKQLFSDADMLDLICREFPEQYSVYQTAKTGLSAILDVDDISLRSLLRFFGTVSDTLNQMDHVLAQHSHRQSGGA